MAEEKDFMDQAVNEFMGWDENSPEETPAVKPDAPAETPPTVETPPPVIKPDSPVPPTPTVMTQEELLREFNKQGNFNFESFEKIKELADKAAKIPELEQQLSVVPELVEALDKTQNPMNYFADETAFKIAMLSKDAKYRGKENLLNEVLRSDLSTLDDIKVIALASAIKASNGVRNPLRAELRGLNINPDEVIGEGVSYDDIEDDVKDILKIRADQYRSELSQIGSEIQAPSFQGTTVETLLNQRKAVQEDYNARLNNTKPIAENIINEIKEIKISDDFAFKLDLTAEQKNAYRDDLAELLISGKYDLNTDAGQAQVYAELMSIIKSDFFDTVVKAYSTHLRTSIEEEMRRKFNNEKPLDRNEPNPLSNNDERDLITRAAELLISERQ